MALLLLLVRSTRHVLNNTTRDLSNPANLHRRRSQLDLGISAHEWVYLVKMIGSIKDMHSLNLDYRAGSEDFHLFQAESRILSIALIHFAS
jgi:hypothetical protein